MKTKVMPSVLFCGVTECAYNDHEKCHAGAITIDGPEPLCDTFLKSQRKGGNHKSMGTVGACKNDRCIHNDSYECKAYGIEVLLHSNQPECNTFIVKRGQNESESTFS